MPLYSSHFWNITDIPWYPFIIQNGVFSNWLTDTTIYGKISTTKMPCFLNWAYHLVYLARSRTFLTFTTGVKYFFQIFSIFSPQNKPPFQPKGYLYPKPQKSQREATYKATEPTVHQKVTHDAGYHRYRTLPTRHWQSNHIGNPILLNRKFVTLQSLISLNELSY